MLYIWLVAQYHFKLYDVNSYFPVTPWAKEWEIYKYGIFVYFYPTFTSTDRTGKPEGTSIFFGHNYFLSCLLALLTEINTYPALNVSGDCFSRFFIIKETL